jgi:hypothetical protein
MNKISARLGFWSSLLIAIFFGIYTLVYIAILVSFHIPKWTNIQDFAAAINEPWFILFTICQFMAFVTGPLFVLLMSSIHDYAEPAKKALSRSALCFAIIFALLNCLHYFVQFSAVRINIAQNTLQGLEPFIQLNPGSIIASINLLGWTVFLALASFFIAPVFSRGGLEKVIKYAFIANGIFCVLGAFGYIFNILILNFVFFNGMGAAIIVISISLAVFFSRLRKSSPAG